MGEIDATDFRTAAGHFTTGVTVVTTLDAEGAPVGLTVNSFATVSLDPPLVLFCLGRDSDGFTPFLEGSGYVVHVLATDQRRLARRFATKGADKFGDSDWSPGRNGLPVLSGALATFECDLWRIDDGGDHVIMVGRVRRLRYQSDGLVALGYFRGQFVDVEVRNI